MVSVSSLRGFVQKEGWVRLGIEIRGKEVDKILFEVPNGNERRISGV